MKSTIKNKNGAWPYIGKNDIEVADTDTYWFISIETIYQYFRYIEALLFTYPVAAVLCVLCAEGRQIKQFTAGLIPAHINTGIPMVLSGGEQHRPKSSVWSLVHNNCYLL